MLAADGCTLLQREQKSPLVRSQCVVVVDPKQANNRLAKRGGHTMAITPRHYLDFINQYANLFNEKRSELEEQQMHLNVGLRKIKETVDQVSLT